MAICCVHFVRFADSFKLFQESKYFIIHLVDLFRSLAISTPPMVLQQSSLEPPSSVNQCVVEVVLEWDLSCKYSSLTQGDAQPSLKIFHTRQLTLSAMEYFLELCFEGFGVLLVPSLTRVRSLQRWRER